MFLRKNLIKISFVVLLSTVLFSLAFSAPIPLEKVANAEDEMVYLGGFPVGITLNSDGLIIEDYRTIINSEGSFCPAKDAGLLIGDMITHVNNTAVKTHIELQTAIGKEPSIIELSILRDNAKIDFKVSSIYDPLVNEAKLGLIVKNEISGVGTVTYVDKNDNFCSLGHKICDFNTNNYHLYQQGKLYSANILGVYKGENGEAGALKGTFNKQKSNIGNIVKNSPFGVYGHLENKEVLANAELVKRGSREFATPGKAYIFSTIEGKRPQKYDIEIIKCEKQNKEETKSMIIRVIDKELIDKTGGIVQGMSGSPIVQNGKLIGAVTHVFLNDATLGYGVYVDWLK